MNTIAWLTACLSLLFLPLRAQVKKLDNPEFQKEIIDQWWSFEDKEGKSGCDMRIFVVKAKEFELNCVNWSTGFSGNKCNYEVAFSENFFGLEMKGCQNKPGTFFLYGYLSEDGHLFLLIREKALRTGKMLLSEKDWIKFEKITR